MEIVRRKRPEFDTIQLDDISSTVVDNGRRVLTGTDLRSVGQYLLIAGELSGIEPDRVHLHVEVGDLVMPEVVAVEHELVCHSAASQGIARTADLDRGRAAGDQDVIAQTAVEQRIVKVVGAAVDRGVGNASEIVLV